MQITNAAELVQYLDDATGGPWLADGDNWHMDAYEIAVYCERPTDWQRVHDLLRAIWTGPMCGEWDDQEPVIVLPGQLFILDLDTTKSQRDDVPHEWDRHKRWLEWGSPVRTTDRSGPGTRGTRKHQGVGPVLIAWR